MVYPIIHSVKVEEMQLSQFFQGSGALASWDLFGLALIVYLFSLSTSSSGRLVVTLPLHSHHAPCSSSVGPDLNVIGLFVCLFFICLVQTMSFLGRKTLHLFILPWPSSVSGGTQ